MQGEEIVIISISKKKGASNTTIAKSAPYVREVHFE